MEYTFKDMYKCRTTTVNDQRQRRALNLERQQRERDVLIANFRNMLHPLETCEPSPSKTDSSVFHNKLMLFEWFSDIPEDISDNWLLMFYPKGERCLVVAKKNRTYIYSVEGECVKSFDCPVFPGGSKSSSALKCITTLDCIYNKDTDSLFVLDVMVWNGLYLIDCPAEMRLFFIQSRINDYFHLESSQKSNKIPLNVAHLYVLPTPCKNLTVNRIVSYLTENENVPYKVDGVLFYHKDAFYYCGERVALVGQLKMPMLFTLLIKPDIPCSFLYDDPLFKNITELKKWLNDENEKFYKNK